MRVFVYGPAYLDRVVRVDGPLLDPSWSAAGPIDRSFDGRWLDDAQSRETHELLVRDESNVRIHIKLPQEWRGPRGAVQVAGSMLGSLEPSGYNRVNAVDFLEDLGGMGAGYASALGGRLVSCLANQDDPTSRAVTGALSKAGIIHDPIFTGTPRADWTLLITSGPFGDKMPIGFRGCHAALQAQQLPPIARLGDGRNATLLVVAGLGNAIAREVFASWTCAASSSHSTGNSVFRFFAPSRRNAVDRELPIATFAEFIDAVSCNQDEWGCMAPADRDALQSRARLLIITDGPRGAFVSFRAEATGLWRRIHVPAFPRARPPVDTNRAGEAFASEFLRSALKCDGDRIAVDEACIPLASRRAAAAASLVLDRHMFGFATQHEIDAALH